jgi:DNA invertase Pin-like site-specific DNA recombinase
VTDLIDLVRHALDPATPIVPFATTVEQRYGAWLTEQEGRGIIFTAEQRQWLDAIKDHLARSLRIDEDQARSGRWTDKRSGYQRLMTEVTLSHVGIVLGPELSRLSRSNAESHRLIDVCGIFHTLLCDQDGVYDAVDGNDRLLIW